MNQFQLNHGSLIFLYSNYGSLKNLFAQGWGARENPIQHRFLLIHGFGYPQKVQQPCGYQGKPLYPIEIFQYISITFTISAIVTGAGIGRMTGLRLIQSLSELCCMSVFAFAPKHSSATILILKLLTFAYKYLHVVFSFNYCQGIPFPYDPNVETRFVDGEVHRFNSNKPWRPIPVTYYVYNPLMYFSKKD